MLVSRLMEIENKSMRIRSSLFIGLWPILATFLPFCLTTSTSLAEDSPPPVDARARELFQNLADRFESLDALAVNTTTIIESRRKDDSLPVRQVLRQRLSFRRPDGLAVKRLVGSAPVTELYYLKPNASLLIPGSGVIERRVSSLPSFFSSRSFGYERSTKSNRIMDQNFAAVTVRDLLVRARTKEWDEDVVGYEYLGQEGSGYGAIHGVKVFEEHESVGVVSAKVWMTDGPRPRIVRVEPDVEHFKKHLGIDMDFRMTAVFDAWDFSPTFTDDVFKRPASTAKVFRTLGQAMREKLKSRSADEKMRERLIGKDVSQLEFEMVDGSKVKVADYIGKQPVLLDFWASWCSPCLQGFSKWEQLLSEERFSDFAFIAVNQGESVATVKALQRERDWKFSIAVDVKREIGRQFEVSAIPQSIVIDKNGRIASVVFGLDDNNKVSVAAELDAVIGDGQTEAQIVEQLRARQEKVKKVVENVAPTVVGLYVRNGGGSGVIVSKDGLVLTAAHVTQSSRRGSPGFSFQW